MQNITKIPIPYLYLQETSLFGQHTVKNHLIETKQEMLKFKIAQDLIKSCKLADSHFMHHLDNQKEQAVSDKNTGKIKTINEEIDDIEKGKVEVWSCKESLNRDTEKLCLEGKESNNLELNLITLVRANETQSHKEEQKNTKQKKNKRRTVK